VQGDVCCSELVRRVLAEEQVDTVLHFAAQTCVDASFGGTTALEFSASNVLGTHTLLEAARRCPLMRRLVHVSTDEVYGEQSHASGAACDEQSALQPRNPYAATKAAAELLVQAYVAAHRLPCIITRSSNVYGPHQFPEKVVPKFALLSLLCRRLPVHGDGSALRSWLYVGDAVEAFDLLLHRGVVGEVYNVGADRELSTLDVARSVCGHTGQDATQSVQFVQDRLVNDRRYLINSAKLRALGWRECTGWEEGLKLTIDWYREQVLGGAYWPDYQQALVAHPTGADDAQPTVETDAPETGKLT